VRSRLEREIEAFMGDRLGRPCLFLPSGRVALYVAFRTWLEPGDRMLMSPVTDDVILFVALAAGLRPVMAPISPDDGNIEPELVPDGTWSTIGGVLTTNLYGLPDRVGDLRSRCDRSGIPLIEDGAHALETTVAGRPIGTFGDAAAFSLSKHLHAGGGAILAFGDERMRSDLERLRDAITVAGRARERFGHAATYDTEALVVALRLVWPARWLRRTLGLVERGEHRMPLRLGELQRAIAAGSGLDAFDSWVRLDLHGYRLASSEPMLRRALRRLRALDGDRARRLEGVRRLRELASVAAAARRADPQPLFRVPLLIDGRDELIPRLERRIRSIGHIHDPPLDDYAGPELVEPSPEPQAARSWCRRVLPIDPLEAERFIGCI
jgi:dTDP-4-amino-4,6-dideoxygalactose transaminase